MRKAKRKTEEGDGEVGKVRASLNSDHRTGNFSHHVERAAENFDNFSKAQGPTLTAYRELPQKRGGAEQFFTPQFQSSER